jgi:hypothetical protein
LAPGGNTHEAVPMKTRIDDAIADAETQDPEEGLATVALLRTRLEELEALQVEKAVRAGWSWRRIAELLGVSKQAVHKKYARRVAARLEAEEAASERKRLVVTGLARQSVRYAREEAEALRETELRPEHLLLGLLRDEGGRAARALDAAGVTLARARAEAGTGRRKPKAAETPVSDVPLPVAPEARAILEESLREAVRRGDDHLGVEHLLLALVHAEGGPALRLLESLDVEAGTLERLLEQGE